MITFKKIKVFISHKRTEGQASTEAILIKEALDKKKVYDSFMDVREDYIGNFPTVLQTKIKECDVFIIVFTGDKAEYLQDENNWVHKEIHYALSYKDLHNKPARIIPIVFNSKFAYPDSGSIRDIKDITNYSFFYYDTNDSRAQERLYKAIGNYKYVAYKKICGIFLSLLFILMIFAGIIKHLDRNELDPAIKEYIDSMESLNSLQDFSSEANKIQTKYLSWYLTELKYGHKDVALNRDFNEYYLKEWCIRITVLSYLANTSGDISLQQDTDLVNELINYCYDKLPDRLRYPIGLKHKGTESVRNQFSEILDILFESLNTHPQIKEIDKTFIPKFKEAIMNQIAPK